jgi:hypothetical protein
LAVACLSPWAAFRFLEGCRSAEAGQDGSHAAAAARPDESHVAAAAPRDAPAEAEHYAAFPGATAAQVAAASPAVAQVVRVSSAEFRADEKAVRVWPADSPADGYSRAEYPGIGGAAVPEPGRDDSQTADAEPAAEGDRYPMANCEFPEEQADYQEHPAGEHFRWAGHQEHCYLERRY